MEEINKNIIGWEKILSNPSEAYQKWFSSERRFLATHIKKNSSVLEVGCGDGRSLKDVMQVTQNITGVDHDETAIQHAKENFKENPKIKLILSEGNNLPFRDETFDYVTCMGTFANFGEDKHQILGEMRRVLKDDGGIIISVYSEDALPERMKAYDSLGAVMVKSVSDNGTVIFDDGGVDGISEQFSEDELKEIFEKENLEIKEIEKPGMAYICLLSKK